MNIVINILALSGLALLGWYWIKLLRFMCRAGYRARKVWKLGGFVNPPRGRMGYAADRVMLSEAEAIERGITSLGGSHGLDSMHPL